MSVAKLAWLLAHALWSAPVLAWMTLFRRGGALVLTHAGDLDARGDDPQMGPLVARLRASGRRVAEVTLVPLDARLGALRARGRVAFVSHAVPAAAARVLAPLWGRERAREAVGRSLLALLRPRAVYLIDESGSGQLYVAGARRLGIPTVGIQHGDFQPHNPQYASPDGRPSARLPVDRLCLWSPWFRERLLAISAIYGEHNTRVCGRLRSGSALAPRSGPEGPLRVLLVAEARDGFSREVLPFLARLRADPGVALAVRPHPAQPAGRWRAEERAGGTLRDALARADVVLGIGSSALLEALYHHRPIGVLLPRGTAPDPAGYVAAGIATGLAEDEDPAAACRRLASGAEVLSARERVWGGAPSNPLDAILGDD